LASPNGRKRRGGFSFTSTRPDRSGRRPDRWPLGGICFAYREKPAPELYTGIREGTLDINPAPTGPIFNRSFFAKKGIFYIEKRGVLR